MTRLTVRVQEPEFDLQAEVDKVSEGNRNAGAIVTFSGLCRDEDGRLAALELEHYPGMAERQIEKIAAQAMKRFGLDAVTAIHRFGRITPGENIVLVIAVSRHRQAAFDGANFLMDYLKTSAPFWKKEHLIDGSTGEWVSAKDADAASVEKWNTSKTA